MSASDYEYNLKKVYTFNTIQGFWAVFNNVPSVDDIQARYSYHLMRNERRPIWEEPYNQTGGAWRLRCNKKDTVNHLYYTLSDAWSGVNWADLMAAQGALGPIFMTGLPER